MLMGFVMEKKNIQNEEREEEKDFDVLRVGIIVRTNQDNMLFYFFKL